jgi:hypothetical protein
MPGMNHGPIFIGGLFKSGTSLLRAMVGQHSAIASGLETYWFDVDWAAGRGRQGEPLSQYIAERAAYFDEDPAQAAAMAAEAAGIEDFLGRLLMGHAARLGKRRWAEKTPGNVLHMDRILAHWPDARILHIVRDPRDVFASLREAGKWDTVDAFASRWCTFLGAAERHKRSLDLSTKRYLEVRYERLVLNPEDAMRDVIAFLGEGWEPACAAFDGKPDDFEKVRAATGKESTTLKSLAAPLTDDRIGLWRRVLDETELAAVRTAADGAGLTALYDRILAETPDGAAA